MGRAGGCVRVEACEVASSSSLTSAIASSTVRFKSGGLEDEADSWLLIVSGESGDETTFLLFRGRSLAASNGVTTVADAAAVADAADVPSVVATADTVAAAAAAAAS